MRIPLAIAIIIIMGILFLWSSPQRSDPEVSRLESTLPPSVLIVLPYRDRDQHADLFMARFVEFMRERRDKGLKEYHYHILFAEQFESLTWNKGFVFDAGYIAGMRSLQENTPSAASLGPTFQDRLSSTDTAAHSKVRCVSMHDVDMHPNHLVDYGDCDPPTRIGSELDCVASGFPMEGSLGGIFAMTPVGWETVNGMSLDYSGWGGEDDDLYWRLRSAGLASKRVPILYPAKGYGAFHCLTDQTARSKPDSDPYVRLKPMKAGSDIWKSDGFSNLEFFQEYGKVVTLDVDSLDGDLLKQNGLDYIDWRVNGASATRERGLIGIGGWSGSRVLSSDGSILPEDPLKGLLSVYWMGLRRSWLPAIEKIEAWIDPGICGNDGDEVSRKTLSIVPFSYKQLFEALGCGWVEDERYTDRQSLSQNSGLYRNAPHTLSQSSAQIARILAISPEIGRGYAPFTWRGFMRWLRSRRGISGALIVKRNEINQRPVSSGVVQIQRGSIIRSDTAMVVGTSSAFSATRQLDTRLNWVPRLKNLCASNRKPPNPKNAFPPYPDRILHGTSFCKNDRQTQRTVFKSIEGADSDILELMLERIKSGDSQFAAAFPQMLWLGNSSLIKLCTGEGGRKQWTRVEQAEDCGGVRDGVSFTHKGTFWVSTDKKMVYDKLNPWNEGQPTFEFCVGYHPVYKTNRVRRNTDCGFDGYDHVLSFNEIDVPERVLTSRLCVEGSAPDKVKTACKEGEGLVVVNSQYKGLILGVSTEVCAQKAGGKMKKTTCSAFEVQRLALIHADSSEGMAWCVGDLNGSICLEKDACSVCQQGIKVRSIESRDLPLSSIEFTRDQFSQ